MKKILLISIIFISQNILYSQYIPMPMQNVTWVNYGGINLLSCDSDCTPVSYKYFTDGDTVINSQNYVKISKKECPDINNVTFFPTFTGAIRQDTLNKIIYVILTDSLSEKILYDFNLNVGDTMRSVMTEISSVSLLTIQSIDSILVQGNYHRRFRYGNEYFQSYVEGIGDVNGLIFPMWGSNKESHLNCMSINGISYYPYGNSQCYLAECDSTQNLEELNNNKIYISPNPSSKSIALSIENSSEINSIKIYSYLGQEMKVLNFEKNSDIDISELVNGIYFIELISTNGIHSREKFVKN